MENLSTVINARRTESLDAPKILQLVKPATESLFGRVNVVNLIEKALLAITLGNSDSDILGHASFLDYPNLEDVDQSEWEQWLWNNYDIPEANALNSLFMHYFVAQSEYTHGCATEIIRTMFNAISELHYCFLAVPNGVYPDSALAETFTQLQRRPDVKGSESCTVFVCYRHQHVPVLHVREARVEDHDDLVPIFNRQSEMLVKTYGDYFLAELIEAQDENMKCLVTEIEGKAVGFMSICKDVNYQMLNECYELGPFHGLRKPHPDDVTSPKLSVESFDPVRVSVKSDSPSNTSRKSSFKGSSKGSKTSAEEAVVTAAKAKLSDAQLGDEPPASISDHQSEVKSVTSEEEVVVQADDEPDVFEAKSYEEITVPLTPPKKRFVPEYHGEPSAFCIQLFCIDERCETRSVDFLNKAFEVFADADFCCISVPHLVPEFPLIQQFVRVSKRQVQVRKEEAYSIRSPMSKPDLNMFLTEYRRVPPRCPSTLAHELYVFGKAGLLRSFQVREAKPQDEAGIENLVQPLNLRENLLRDLKQFYCAKRDQDGTEIQAFVSTVSDQVIGVAILRAESNIEYVRAHYNIEDFIYFNHHRRDEHGHLHHFALNPVFNHYSKYFMKEILRLGHKTCLYYPLYPSYVSPQTISRYTLVTSLTEMVPVRGRRQVEYNLDVLGQNAPSERVLQKHAPYALNHINRKLVLEPKLTINARIVVIGASETALSFLETFAFCPHLRFNNLTLVSPHGLPGELKPEVLRDNMIPSSYGYSHQQYVQVALRAWVNVIYGKMTAINRKKKHVTVDGNTIVPYDHLVPAPSGADVDSLATSSELPMNPNRRYDGPVPHNVFVINDVFDAGFCLRWVEKNILQDDGRVLIYGGLLHSYTCINSMLAMGISGKRIDIVRPPSSHQVPCFNNPDVALAVEKQLMDLGVMVYTNYLLAQWNDGNDTSSGVRTASFTSNTKPLRLVCSAFVSFYKKQVDYDAFKAMNDACLVFDGRLVIDAEFHTNDAAIRGAGPITKFQRAYHADQWTHANFNSKEVGVELARSMLRLFDPTLEPEPIPTEDVLKLIPMYKSPRIQQAMLPGGFHYLQVDSPGLDVTLEARKSQSDFGREIITGTANEDSNYFNLHFNQYKCVESITCFSKKKIPYDNLVQLYSVHERYLKNLFSRFDEGLVGDLYRYFEESWAVAIFHDRFADFRDEIRELLSNQQPDARYTIEERVRTMIDEDLTLSAPQRELLLSSYSETGVKRAVEMRLMSYLSYNYYHLPMYARPGIL